MTDETSAPASAVAAKKSAPELVKARDGRIWIVRDYAGAVVAVPPKEAEGLVRSGEARFATAHDLKVAGVDPA